MMVYQLEEAVMDKVNCLEENLFFIDIKFRVGGINEARKKLIDTLKSYLKSELAED
jgi:rsbT co-antagonist protein RsbR